MSFRSNNLLLNFGIACYGRDKSLVSEFELKMIILNDSETRG